MLPERDFVIELTGESPRYRVHVQSPAGEHTNLVTFNPSDVVGDLRALQANVLASAARVRDFQSLRTNVGDPLRQIGIRLFELVLGGSAGALFLASRNEVERREQQLRVVLRLPAELAVLPWELLYDSRHESYVCRRSTLVRYVDVPEPVLPLKVEPPLHIVGMTALPGSLLGLDADAEQQRLRDVLAPLACRLTSTGELAGQRLS